MQIHGYTQSGSIDATIDGQRITVPDDPGNRHRQQIAAWEESGNTIPPYTAPAPSVDPADYPLTDRQLRLGLIEAGILPSAIETAIQAIADPFEREAAWTWFDRSAVIHWGHPRTQALIVLAGLTAEQAVGMWLQAKDLET